MTVVSCTPAELAPQLENRAPGRTHWRVRIEARDAQGTPVHLELPVVVVTAKAPGRTLLLTGGVHGNEYEGPAALLELAQEQAFAIARGRVIIAPTVNPAALAARVRRSPQDGLDLNRSFPGDAAGSITQAIAAFMAEVLTPAADAVLDLHAGGEDSLIIPSTMIHFLADRGQMRATLDLALAFGAPAVLVYDEQHPGLFDTHVESHGLPFVCAELGGAGMLTRESLAIADAGVRRALAAMNLIDAPRPEPFAGWRDWTQPKMLVAPDFHAAQPPMPRAGFVRPSVEIGERVEPHTCFGTLHPPESPWEPKMAIPCGIGGMVYARFTGGIAAAGDTIGIIGQELVAEDLAEAVMRIVPASRA
jgi:N-alpha-acetyl-L-2,4-diaminobutyrate deacetylase